jgi:hypothetical protein
MRARLRMRFFCSFFVIVIVTVCDCNENSREIERV